MLNSLIQQLDKKIFLFVNSSLKNSLFDKIFPIITRLGEDLVIIFVTLCLLIFGKKKEKINSILMLVTLVFARLSVLVVKHITHRPRPSFVYENVNLIGNPIFSSFPSGHTTLATSVCVILCFKYRKLSPVFISLAVLVGISRVYVGQHYPSDVIAGFILGSLIAFIVLYLESSLQRKNIKSGA